MDRLVRELDRLIEVGVLQDEVIVQAAAFRYMPRFARAERIMPFTQVPGLINEADVVISHAGPATLAVIRGSGRVAIVVPRLVRYGEHVDEHQALYAKRLAMQPGYVIVEVMSQLAEAITRARGSQSAAPKADVSRAVAALNEIVEGLERH